MSTFYCVKNNICFYSSVVNEVNSDKKNLRQCGSIMNNANLLKVVNIFALFNYTKLLNMIFGET